MHWLGALAAGRSLLEAPLEWDYLAIVSPQSFAECERCEPPALVVAVARAGATRLLDNVTVAGPSGVDPILTPERPLRTRVESRGPT